LLAEDKARESSLGSISPENIREKLEESEKLMKKLKNYLEETKLKKSPQIVQGSNHRVRNK
jgi:hypothetical protein